MKVLDSFRLEGRTALVTGCRRGLGFAMAEGLAEAGADIVGVSASQEAEGSAIERKVRALGRRFRGHASDFSDRKAVHRLVETVLGEGGVPDILVNNAGTIHRAPAADHADDDWDRVLEVNLNAPFVLAREFGARMVERGRGRIIFTASLLSYQGGVTVPSYAASKGGIAQLTKALSNEWASRGVNVNAIAPGYFATDNTEALQRDPTRSRQILERVPAGRWGEPDDLKGAVVFLASDASRYVTGEVLVVDGGWMGR